MENKQQAKKRIEKLRKEIDHNRYLYHVLDKPEMSDAAWDSLKNELAKLEAAFPELVTSDSPTQRVGGRPLDKFVKVAHSSPMMSLFDSFSEEDMRDWEERIRKLAPGANFNYYCELKLDGLAVALRYEKGMLSRGATRGDGKVGEDVTQNIKTIASIPLALRIPKESELKKIGLNNAQIKAVAAALKDGVIEARGEAIMTKKVLKELNKKYKKEGRPLLANPRNGAAGSIRQLDPKLAAERKLDFIVYALGAIHELRPGQHEQEHELARLLGFKVLAQNKFCLNLDSAIAFHHEQENKRDRLDFECDGVVVKVNDLALWPKLGTVGKGPRYIMAYKFAAEQVTTKVRDAIWQVGRTGALTPIAVLEPVKVGGVTVSHATLHNMDEIKRLGIKIGDTVIIERAGDVIPKVVEALPKLRDGQEKNIKIPDKCPICGTKLVKARGEVAYRCTNKDCYAVNLRRLIHWASKGAMDIEGLGPKVIEQLVKKGLVSDVSGFYALKEGDLKPLERFADKSAENLIKAIEVKKEVDLARFIYGLGIRHVGEETAMLLAQRIMNYELRIKNEFLISDLIKIFQKIDVQELEKISDIGPIMAKSIYKWFRDGRNLRLLEKLQKNGVSIRKQENKKAKKQNLAGKIFVLTGTLEGLTRDEAKRKIRELGGDISSSVSKNTDFVAAGDDPGSKYDKAKKLGVKIIGEEEFINLITHNI